MEYKSVHSIEHEFSKISLGGRQFGGKEYWSAFDKNNAIGVINTAIDKGVNFIDTCPTYGNSESFIGEVLHNEKKRNKVYIGSKCGLIKLDNGNYKNDLSRESILKEVDETLTRLKTDYIDIYQCSWPDPNTSIEETMETMVYLKKLGKIRFIGLTNFSYNQVVKALRVGKVNSLQGYYNIINRNPQNYYELPLNYYTEKDLFRICYEENIAFFPYSGLFHGILTNDFEKQFRITDHARKNDPKLQGETGLTYKELVTKLYEFSQSIGKGLNHVALNFLLEKDLVTSVLVGASNQDHFLDNLEALNFKLSEEELEHIDRLVRKFSFQTGEIFN